MELCCTLFKQVYIVQLFVCADVNRGLTEPLVDLSDREAKLIRIADLHH